MIEITNTKIVGWEVAIRGMRNPMNSWEKSDSYWDWDDPNFTPGTFEENQFHIGEKDLDLMKRLTKGGADDRKFMRMIVVYLDITAPLYWWKEFDTYKVGTVANSCSTMHKIHAKEFALEDFSFDHIGDVDEYVNAHTQDLLRPRERLIQELLHQLNLARNAYLATKDKKYWWAMIQLLPSSYNQKRTVMLNYEVLRNMYHARKNHKLDEWHVFCDWIEGLPYSELITGEE